MSSLIRALGQITKYAGIGLVVLLALAVAVILAAGFVPSLTQYAADKVAAMVSTPERQIAISDPSGLLSGHLRVKNVTISDEDGTFATIDNIAVNWSPLELLGGKFHARTVAADRIEVTRQPKASTESNTTETDSSGFSLPVAIDVDRLTVPEIALSENITGRPFDLTLDGSAAADSNSIALNLAINRRDVPDAKALADILFAPDENRLTLKASVSEPKGGLLVKALNIAGEPAIDLSLDGSGPLSDWSGTLSGSANGQQLVTIKGTHHQTVAGMHDVSLTGGGEISALLPETFRTFFAGETDINVAGSFNENGKITVDKSDIANASFRLSASGALDPAGQNDLQASISGVSGPIDFRWPLAEGELRALITSARLSVTGPATASGIKVSAALQSVAMPGISAGDIAVTAASSSFDVAGRTGQLATTLSVGSTAFANPNLQRLVRAPLKLTAPLKISDDRVGFDGTELESASIGGTVNGGYQISERRVTGNLQLFALPATLPGALAAKVSDTIQIRTDFDATLPGSVALSDLIVKSDVLDLSGNATLADNKLTADIAGSIPELSKFVANTAGSVSFKSSLAGPLTALEFDASAEAENVSMAGKTLESLNVSAKGTADPDAPQAALTASGNLDGQRIDAKANVVSKDGKINLPELTADVGPNHLEGAIELSADFTPDGKIRFDFPDVSLLAAFAGQQAAGDLSGTVDIASQSGTTKLSVTANGQKLQAGTASVAEPKVDLTATIGEQLAANGTVKASSVASGSNQVKNLSLGFDQQGAATDFKLLGTYDNAPLKADGRLTTSDGTMVSLNDFQAKPRGIPLSLAKPVDITVKNGAARFKDLTVKTGSGSVSASGSVGSSLDVQANITNLPADLANSFVPTLGAEGTISGKLTAKGALSAPVVDFQLNWGNAAVAASRSQGIPAFGLKANGTFANNKLDLQTDLSGPGGLNIGGNGNVNISGDRPLSYKLTGAVPFSLLAAKLAEQGFVLNGNASVDLTVSGGASSPQVSGTLSAKGAQLIDVRRNLVLNDLTANVSLSGEKATISALSGKLATGGSLSATGEVGISSGSGFPADIRMTIDNAVYVNGTLVTSTVDGKLSLTGPLVGSPTLSGEVRLQKTAITVPQKLPASLSEINVNHRNAPADVRAQASEIGQQGQVGTSSSSSGINLDLAISAPREIFVRGRGIDAELGGNLTVKGSTSSPVVSGGFTMQRGRLTILNKRLDFSSGTITFGGGLIPLLNMVATSSVNSNTITVDVSGFANDPDFTFSSSPALPQDEVLAQLIFGSSMSKLSALQIAQLASAVNQLAGGRSTSLFDSLRSGLGVDDLDISTSNDGQAEVSAGKYLNNRTYLQLEQSGSSGGKAIINLDVGKGVKLRGEAGSDGSAGGGIFYEKEY
ncbi:translocation/assembly module TamB domain-containing protein [Rhizobium sp. PAMB 3182]